MKMKKVAVTFALVLAVTSVTAFTASAYTSPAEAAAGLTGRTLESVTEERLETGKSYGTIANEAGKLDEFKAEMLEMKKTILDKKVADGIITREQADETLAVMKEKIETCDGTGDGLCGQGFGLGFGKQNNKGQGLGRGNGQGRGQGRGICNGLGNGSGL